MNMSRILTWNMQNQPIVHSFGSATYAADWVLPERTIPDHEIFLMFEGETTFWLDRRLFHLKPGDVLLFGPNQLQYGEAVDTGGRTWSYHVHYSPEATPEWIDAEEMAQAYAELSGQTPGAGTLLESGALSRRVYLHEHLSLGAEQDAIFRLFERAREEQFSGRYGALQLAGLLLGEIILRLTRITLERALGAAAPSRKTNPLFQEAVDLMNRNMGPNLSMEALARQLQMTPQHLIRIFRAGCGQSPLDYYNSQRILRAKELIRYSGLQMKEIARMLGFAHPHYFSRLFKATEGVTPMEFRRRLNREVYRYGDRATVARPTGLPDPQ